MIVLLATFFRTNWVPLAVVGGILLGVASVYVKGHRDGSAAAEAAAKTAVVNQLKERNATDAKVEGMPPADLCRAIGGVWSDNRCQ